MFLVKGKRSQRYALKRMAVNNEQDLYMVRQEIAITVSWNKIVLSLVLLTPYIYNYTPECIYRLLISSVHYNHAPTLHSFMPNMHLSSNPSLSLCLQYSKPPFHMHSKYVYSRHLCNIADKELQKCSSHYTILVRKLKLADIS